MSKSNTQIVQEGDLAQLLGKRDKRFIVQITSGGRLQTHLGILEYDDLIGKPWGSQVASHLGHNFFLLQPSLEDLLLNTRRETQIMYPKDIGYILLKLGIGPGTRVIEAGTGSGAFATALAFAVGDEGEVISYEVREDMQNLARKNLKRLGLLDRVTLKLRNIEEGFDEEGVDALFLDVPNPEDYMAQVRQALKSGGFFGCLLPTVNQITRLLNSLKGHRFAFVEVCEILFRQYKPIAERLRPVDRMIAHTGYLIFARPFLFTRPGESSEED